MPSTAWSIGASSKTMFAALPPSSIVIFRSVPGELAHDGLADLGRSGEGDFGRVGWPMTAAPVSPAPVTKLTTPGGSAGVLEDLRQLEGGDGGRLGGLEDDAVAHGEGRRELPGQHEEREIPGDDLADDAERGDAGGRAATYSSLSAQPAW